MSGTKFNRRWRELKTVFRLPQKVAEVAARFGESFELNQELKTESIVQISLFDRPINPHVVWKEIRPSEKLKIIEFAFNKLKEEGCTASDMVVLLPNHKIGMECVSYFESKQIHVNHVFGDESDTSRHHKKSFWMGDSRLKMSTIHSFKGWEVLSVILYIDEEFFGDLLQLDAIIYTAITRSRENLIVLNSHSRYSEFGKSLPSKWNEQ